MKEKYIPMEPLEKGIEVAAISAKKITEVIRPKIELRMRRSTAELMAIIFGENN